METFSALPSICAGNSPATGEFPSPRPVTRSFDVFFDLCLNKRLSKQSWRWWFETPSHPLWRHCNEVRITSLQAIKTESQDKCRTFRHLISINQRCPLHFLRRKTSICIQGPFCVCAQPMRDDVTTVTSSLIGWAHAPVSGMRIYRWPVYSPGKRSRGNISMTWCDNDYRKISNIRRTKYQNSNVSSHLAVAFA